LERHEPDKCQTGKGNRGWRQKGSLFPENGLKGKADQKAGIDAGTTTTEHHQPAVKRKGPRWQAVADKGEALAKGHFDEGAGRIGSVEPSA